VARALAQRIAAVGRIVVAEAEGDIVGFVTVDPRTLYLDQIVVAPDSGKPVHRMRWRP
jgi:hypothetical protein